MNIIYKQKVLFIFQLVNNLRWNIVMDDWNLDEKSLGEW